MPVRKSSVFGFVGNSLHTFYIWDNIRPQMSSGAKFDYCVLQLQGTTMENFTNSRKFYIFHSIKHKTLPNPSSLAVYHFSVSFVEVLRHLSSYKLMKFSGKPATTWSGFHFFQIHPPFSSQPNQLILQIVRFNDATVSKVHQLGNLMLFRLLVITIFKFL